MTKKNPSWTRARVGRNRVRWVAYDDRVGSVDCQVIAQGYALSLPEADASARSALAAHGMFQARRMGTGSFSTVRNRDEKPRRPSRPAGSAPDRPREYLYTRRIVSTEQEFFVAAHLILKKTSKRVYVTRKSIGLDQIGSEDERWDENEATLAIDRAKLERDGSAYAPGHRTSDFYRTIESAAGEAITSGPAAMSLLGLRSPFSVEEIKSAYRRKAFEAHPDRGGYPGDFEAVEAAYRHLLRKAQGDEP